MFRGVAPAEGASRAYVTLAGQDGRIALGTVEVRRAEGAPAAEVDLALPDTAINGAVVDPDGRPQPEATVSAWGENGRLVYVRSAADGSFAVEGVPPGRVELSAEAAPSSASDAVVLTVREGEPAEDVRLVVRPKTKLRGRILGPGGPVPGALVWWEPAGRRLSLMTVTASSGRLDVDLPGASPVADLLIVAAGLPRALRRVAAAGEKIVDIAVGGEAGLLVVTGPAADSASVCQSDLCMPLGSFLQIPGPMPPPELALSTGDYRLPVEPGEWSVCHAPTANGGCTNVQVLPGGVATVRVD